MAFFKIGSGELFAQAGFELNCSSPDLCLLSSWDYMSHWWLASKGFWVLCGASVWTCSKMTLFTTLLPPLYMPLLIPGIGRQCFLLATIQGKRTVFTQVTSGVLQEQYNLKFLKARDWLPRLHRWTLLNPNLSKSVSSLVTVIGSVRVNQSSLAIS
jgi:hypothetical protein